MATPSQSGIDTVMIRSQQITDANTVTANLDTRGADYATIRLNLGTEEGTDATPIVVSLLEDDTTVVTNFSTITADLAPSLVTGQEVRYEIDLKGRQRYLRLSVTSGTGTGSNLDFGAIATLYKSQEDPASTTAMGDDVVVIL